MAYDENGGGFQRPKFQGNWKCSKCGAEITELPFEPSPDRIDQLQCKDCYQPKKSFRNDRGGGRGGFPGRKFQGSWKCSKCGAEITELPFEPSPDRIDQLQCKECYQPRRSSFRNDRF